MTGTERAAGRGGRTRTLPPERGPLGRVAALRMAGTHRSRRTSMVAADHPGAGRPRSCRSADGAVRGCAGRCFAPLFVRKRKPAKVFSPP